MQDGTPGRLGRASAMALTAAGLALSACGGDGPAMRDVAYPSLADRAPESERVSGDALSALVEGEEIAWSDSREEVAFTTTVSYARNGRAVGSWENADTERSGNVEGRWEIQGDRLCVTYAVKEGDDSDGLSCYALYRQNTSLYLVGAEKRIFETAPVPGSGEDGGSGMEP